MDIRKADSKGRVTTGKAGEVYVQKVQEDGTIVLAPVDLKGYDKFPGGEGGLEPGVYVSVGRFGGDCHSVTIASKAGMGYDELADLVVGLAGDWTLPVLVASSGLGSAFADTLVEAGVTNVLQCNPSRMGKGVA